jgi:hypothetical protein
LWTEGREKILNCTVFDFMLEFLIAAPMNVVIDIIGSVWNEYDNK